MFAQPDSHSGRCCVGVIRCGNRHSINVLVLFFQHLAEVGILWCLCMAFKHMCRLAGVDIAKRDDVLALAAVDVDLAFATGTYRSDVKAFVSAEHTAR